MSTEFERLKQEALRALDKPEPIRQKTPINLDPAHYIEKPEKRSSLLTIGMSFFCIVLIVAGLFFYIKGTPRYSLYQFRSAVDDRDVDGAMKYLDIDSIVDKLAQDVITPREEPPAQNEYEQMGRNFGKGLMMLMLPALKEAAKTGIREQIANPKHPGQEGKYNFTSARSLWDLSVEQTGNIAVVSISDPKSAVIKMRKAPEGHWRIVEFITDLPKSPRNNSL